MPATWKQLTFVPSSNALRALRENWGWRVPETMQAFMASASGDVFFEANDLSIYWLDTGQGKLEQIAIDRAEFLGKLKADCGVEWLLAQVIDQLVDAGVLLQPDQCFAFKVLPIMGGTYTPQNMTPMSAADWYGFSGYAHHQIKDLPDGAQVKFVIED